jgi:hypothetical protein
MEQAGELIVLLEERGIQGWISSEILYIHQVAWRGSTKIKCKDLHNNMIEGYIYRNGGNNVIKGITLEQRRELLADIHNGASKIQTSFSVRYYG